MIFDTKMKNFELTIMNFFGSWEFLFSFYELVSRVEVYLQYILNSHTETLTLEVSNILKTIHLLL